jgi:hypothetical protein
MSSVAALPVALAGYAVNAASNMAWFFPVLMAAIAYFHYELLDPESRPIDVATELLHQEYDFIIVGAGSAGMYSTRYQGGVQLPLTVVCISCSNNFDYLFSGLPLPIIIPPSSKSLFHYYISVWLRPSSIL